MEPTEEKRKFDLAELARINRELVRLQGEIGYAQSEVSAAAAFGCLIHAEFAVHTLARIAAQVLDVRADLRAEHSRVNRLAGNDG